MECESRDRAVTAYEDSEHPIDQEHKRVMDGVLVYAESTSCFELLDHLTNRE